MASEGLFSGCWTPATLRTFQVPLRASQLKVKAFYTRVGALADLKISKACRNIYRRIFSGGVIAWHGRNDLRDTTGLPFAKLTRIDIPVRSNFRTLVYAVSTLVRSQRCCGQECPRAGGGVRMRPYRLFLSDDEPPCEAGADTAGAEGGEYVGRDSTAGARGAETAGGGEYERVGCGVKAGAGALHRACAGAGA